MLTEQLIQKLHESLTSWDVFAIYGACESVTLMTWTSNSHCNTVIKLNLLKLYLTLLKVQTSHYKCAIRQISR